MSAGPTRSTPSTSALRLTVDESLVASLPARIGGMAFNRHSLASGDEPPAGFSDELGRALLRASGSADGTLSVAWSAPAGDVADPVYGVRFLAIRIPGAVARDLREGVALDWLLVPGFSGQVQMVTFGRTSMLSVGDRAVASTGDTLFILIYPPAGVRPSVPPGPAPTAPFTSAEFFAVLPASDPEPVMPRSTPRPVPSVPPDASPPPDRAAEALLPSRIRGTGLATVSGRGPSLFTGQWVYLALPAYALYKQGVLDPQQVSAAGGHPDGLSTFWIVATPVPGLDSKAILAAWFRPLLANSLGVETVEANGRLGIVYNNQAVYAADGVLYWMTYLDVGDFPSASPAPRPAIRDLVIDTLSALP